MIVSSFPSGSGGGGGGGGRYAAEIFNFPMTVSDVPPTNPSQGEREGHIWMVCSKEDQTFIDTIVIDGVDRATYTTGTMLIRVPFFGEDKVYIHQNKQVGSATVLPLSYVDTRSPLTNFWPVTLINETGISARMDLGRPWDYAKLYKADTWIKCPLWYFDGEKWIEPLEYQYAYWSSERNTTAGVDTRWLAYTVDVENNFHKGQRLEEFDLKPFIDVISGGNKANEPNPVISVNNKTGILKIMAKDIRNHLFDSRDSKEYMFKINKRELLYLGVSPFNYTPNVVGLRSAIHGSEYIDNSEMDDVYYITQDWNSSKNQLTNYYIETSVYNENENTIEIKQTNKIASTVSGLPSVINHRVSVSDSLILLGAVQFSSNDLVERNVYGSVFRTTFNKETFTISTLIVQTLSKIGKLSNIANSLSINTNKYFARFRLYIYGNSSGENNTYVLWNKDFSKTNIYVGNLSDSIVLKLGNDSVADLDIILQPDRSKNEYGQYKIIPPLTNAEYARLTIASSIVSDMTSLPAYNRLNVTESNYKLLIGPISEYRRWSSFLQKIDTDWVIVPFDQYGFQDMLPSIKTIDNCNMIIPSLLPD